MHQQNTAAYLSTYTFSGKERDVETSLSYFGARYYEAGLSIWLSVDPLSDKYPYQSAFTYCGWNPLSIIDPDGRDEFELDKKTGAINKVSETRFFRESDGTITTIGTDIEYSGTGTEVDKLKDSKGKEMYVNSKSLRQPLKNSSVKDLMFFEFSDNAEAANFFEFVAEGSDVEWGYARQNENASSYVGTNGGNGHSVFGAFMEQSLGSSLIMLMHSHPTGGEPSVDLHGPNGTRVGDLNAAYSSKFPNLLRKVYDVPNRRTYDYDGSTYVSGKRYNSSHKGFKP